MNPRNPPQKKAAKKRSASKKDSTDNVDKAKDEILQVALTELKDLAEFHKVVKEAEANDLRIYWDVRVLKGENELFAQTKGQSSLPSALGPKMRSKAATMLQQEVIEKIAQPLSATCMEYVDAKELEEKEDPEDEDHAQANRIGMSPVFSGLGEGRDPMDVAAE